MKDLDHNHVEFVSNCRERERGKSVYMLRVLLAGNDIPVAPEVLRGHQA